MAKRVTPQDIEQMNEMYYICQNYAEVARKTGWSSSTVAKYVDKNYTPKANKPIKPFENTVMAAADVAALLWAFDEWGSLCLLSPEEEIEISKLWEEMTI